MELLVVSVGVFVFLMSIQPLIPSSLTEACCLSDAHGGAVLRLPQDQRDSGVSVSPYGNVSVLSVNLYY